jgi:hypothetical protein
MARLRGEIGGKGIILLDFFCCKNVTFHKGSLTPQFGCLNFDHYFNVVRSITQRQLDPGKWGFLAPFQLSAIHAQALRRLIHGGRDD